MVLKRGNPGCPCCEEECPECKPIYTDGGEDEQLSGDWTFDEMEGTALSMDVPAKILDTGTHNGGFRVSFGTWWHSAIPVPHTRDSITKVSGPVYGCHFGDATLIGHLVQENPSWGVFKYWTEWELSGQPGVFSSGVVGTTPAMHFIQVCASQDYYGGNVLIFTDDGIAVNTSSGVSGSRVGYSILQQVIHPSPPGEEQYFLRVDWPIAAQPLDEVCHCGSALTYWSEWPHVLQVELSGIGSGVCVHCDDLNGTYLLEHRRYVSGWTEQHQPLTSIARRTVYYYDISQPGEWTGGIRVRFYFDGSVIKFEVAVITYQEDMGDYAIGQLSGTASLPTRCDRAKWTTDVQAVEVDLDNDGLWNDCCDLNSPKAIVTSL